MRKLKNLVVFLFVVMIVFSSCGRAFPPCVYTPMVIVKFDNPSYYDYVLGYGIVLQNTETGEMDFTGVGKSRFMDILDTTYTDLENGYKIMSNKLSRGYCPHLSDYCINNNCFVIMDMTRKEYADYIDSTGIEPTPGILDANPNFEFYIFTFNNLGPYRNKMTYRHVYDHIDLIRDFYPFYPSEDSDNEILEKYNHILKSYVGDFNNIILNNPEDMENYCTVYVKNNKQIINRPNRYRPNNDVK